MERFGRSHILGESTDGTYETHETYVTDLLISPLSLIVPSVNSAADVAYPARRFAHSHYRPLVDSTSPDERELVPTAASSRNLVISSGKGGKTPNSVTKPVTKRRGVTSKA
jgi:hypothetical protein